MFNPFRLTHGILGIVVGIIRVLPDPLAKVFRSVAYGFAVIWRTRAGKWMLGVALVLALVDASFGSDPIYLFLFGPLLTGMFVVAVAVVGAIAWGRRMAWEDEVEHGIYHAVPGHSRSQEPEIRYSLKRTGIHTNRWTGSWDFAFYVPAKLRLGDVPRVEEHLREILPAAKGSSWDFDWNLRGSTCAARIKPDLPDEVVRAPSLPDPDKPEQGVAGGISPDPEQVPLGMSLGGVIHWTLDANTGNIFVTGGPGGGKSVLVNNIVRHCLEHPTSFQLDAIDMKGGVELGDLERFAVVDQVADNLDASLELLRELREDVDRRQAELRKLGAKKISKLNQKRADRGEPLLKRRVLVVDELAELTDVPEISGRDPEQKELDKKRAECKALLDSIVRLGRAGGVHVAAALQRPDVRYLGGAMRSNIQARAITGRIDRAGAQMVESDLATTLPAEHPGRGVWWVGGREEKVQYFLVEDEDLDRAAQGVTV